MTNKQQALEELKAVMKKYKLSFTIDKGLLILSSDFDLEIKSYHIGMSDIQTELNRMKNDD